MRFILTILLIFSGIILHSQQAQIVKEFPFNEPFVYATFWDENEGPLPGPHGFHFIDNSHILFWDGITETFVILNSNYNIESSYKTDWGMKKVIFGKRYILVISYATQTNHTILFIDRLQPGKFQRLEIPELVTYSLLLVDNFIFGLTPIKHDLISWTFETGFKNLKYHDEDDTRDILFKKGMAEYLNYSVFSKYGDQPRFGNKIFDAYNTAEPVIPSGFRGYTFDKDLLIKLGFDDPDDPSLVFIGKDKKGLYYFSGIMPNIMGKGPDGESKTLTYENKDKNLVFFVADPWRKKIAIRSIPGSKWDPPVNSRGQLCGNFPTSVDPEGNLYFFDANVKRKVYTLNRIFNDWWDELDFNKVKTGLVNENRVRIREKPDLQSRVLGYVYEDENLIIEEISKHKDIVGNSQAPWLKVLLPDGRKGWVFGQFIDY